MTIKKLKLKEKLNKSTIFKYLFIYGILIYPLLNWVVFTLIGTISTVTSSFQTTNTETWETTWVGLDNYKRVIQDFSTDGKLLGYMWNSMRYWIISFVIGMPLNILFGYFIVVNIRGISIYRFCILLPTMISGMVTSMLMAKFADNVLPILLEDWFGIKTLSLLSDNRFNFETLIVMTLLNGFSYNIIIYSNAMKGTGESLFEVANLEGATHLQKLWYICIPSVYEIVAVNVITSIPGLFTGNPDLYIFYGYNPPERVMGVSFYIFQKAKNADTTQLDYSYSTAVSLFFNLTTFPITLLVKYIMDRMDPNNE